MHVVNLCPRPHSELFHRGVRRLYEWTVFAEPIYERLNFQRSQVCMAGYT